MTTVNKLLDDTNIILLCKPLNLIKEELLYNIAFTIRKTTYHDERYRFHGDRPQQHK
jgi:hypothetical protein